MTPLEAIIRDEIASSGPMRIDRFMGLCLNHPEYGYYMTRDPLGADGDFITAPEVSQMFGELIGLWLAQYWLDLGRPPEFQLLELGPGRGTLMSDVVRAAGAVPGFLDAARICLLETSPTLKSLQARALQGQRAIWLDDLDDLAQVPLLCVANEFFDALPIRQFQRIGDVWMERFVVLGEDALRFSLGKTSEQRFDLSFPDGTIVERSPAQLHVASHLAQQIEVNGGAALIFDYGDIDGRGDTLQAVSGHQCEPVFQAPGEADLTAHVDFGQLAGAVGDCAAHLTTQGQFLKAMGIEARAEVLAKGKDNDTCAKLDRAVQRLTSDEQMGKLFKVMAITRLDAATPAGF